MRVGPCSPVSMSNLVGNEKRYFKCFFIAWDEAVESIEAVELVDEAAAIRRAQEMLRSKPILRSAEIWESGRFVARLAVSRVRT